MNRIEKLYLLAFCTFLTFGVWYGTQKLGAETIAKIGATCFGIGAVMHLVQSVKVKPQRKRRKV